MPELPEVETIVRAARPRLVGRTIVRFESRWPRQIHPDVPAVRRGVLGCRVRRVDRRGKYIVLRLDDGGALLIHLRMSGRLEWAAGHAVEPAHVRAVFDLDDGQRLMLCDARKFGRIAYTTDWRSFSARLGVEPLGPQFTPRRLAHELSCRARRLKPLLLDQSVIAGIGNIYADEALHRAGLHPCRRCDTLAPEQVRRLRSALRAVLRQGIRNQGASIDWIYPGGRMQRRLRVYGRGGEACDRCGAPIATTRVAQRSTHFCPACQPLDEQGDRGLGRRRRAPRRAAACAG
ncbi:MAG: bifunctional DNA-formamidopyrimidine glycosylase/DNA-(apurinic or apyrimidinic site) lyase [Phycisphaerae bacterium]|nr:bifunctional DNA-formamidopyrimidine glycosylase/DNA-(apurinic or apyrimidinic site) lyase [Phycisphaerae bacterium]MCZ2400839.1 bifunctional DNA-formamidopyrimidine glycosylase/DNA-(apurinic or apyrimidinic site) lyase [Phycisphaerae bacterium]